MAADITKLRPKTQALCKLFIEACAKAGITVLITQTHRDSTLQHAYFSQGRESLAVVNANRAKAGLSALTASENKATITKADAGRALDSTIGAVAKALKKGDRISLVGFGSFSVAKRAARLGRNPQTGKEIKIAAKKVVKFKAGTELATSVNKGK